MPAALDFVSYKGFRILLKVAVKLPIFSAHTVESVGYGNFCQ